MAKKKKKKKTKKKKENAYTCLFWEKLISSMRTAGDDRWGQAAKEVALRVRAALVLSDSREAKSLPPAGARRGRG